MNNYQYSWSFTDSIAKNNIHYIFGKFGIPNLIVEVGTFEGGTTFYISDTYSSFVSKMKIYCIDPHSTSDDLSDDLNEVKQRFLHNLSVCANKNIEYISKPSVPGLIDLINQNVRAQFIYVDGDHKGSTVLSDLVLAFHMLEVGGVILCDDTNWKHPADSDIPDSPSMTPRMAVENFIQCNWHRLTVLDLPNGGNQTAFVKTKE
jgi:cephalosporin hydroxylase